MSLAAFYSLGVCIAYAVVRYLQRWSPFPTFFSSFVGLNVGLGDGCSYLVGV